MPEFNNTDDAIKYLVKNHKKVFKEVIKETIIPTIQESIDDIVYDAYNPTQYARRKDKGGLRDVANFDYSIDIFDNTISIIVKNIAEPNTKQDVKGRIDNVAKNKNKYQYLDWMIVYGQTYTWINSSIYKQQPFPRDFYADATRILRTKLPITIARKFKQLGIEVDYEVIIR